MMEEIGEKVITTKVFKKRRIILVAKEFSVSVESLVEFLAEKGIVIKNHMSPVSEEMYNTIFEHYGKDSVEVSEDLRDDSELKRKDQNIAREKERLESVRQKLREMSEEKPPTLEEVQREALLEVEKEKQADKVRKESAKEKKQKEELEKKEAELKLLKEEAENKLAKGKKIKEQEARRLERLLAHPTKGVIVETEAVKTKKKTKKYVKDEEGKKLKPDEKVVDPLSEEISDKKEKPTGEAELTDDDKKKRKKKKDRIAEEKQKAEQKTTGRGKRKRKKDKKPQASAEEVEAAIKKTMQAMEEKGKTKRKKQRGSLDDEIEELDENVLKVSEFISVAELAQAMDVESNEVIKKCMDLGLFVSINQRLDMDAIITVADEFDFEVEQEELYGMDVIEELEEEADDPDKMTERPPVVTIMGHVDHGKTSLLDYIRKSNIIAGEKGGITQHIGAYVVQIDKKKVTFLDTPGHEAFTAMRARGAQVTDIVVLVVAADDKVMPQTIEAINHARAANVPIFIAINKIDKPNANPDLIKTQLADIGIQVEDWGGSYSSVEISAKTGENVDQLMELLVLQAEMMELKANADRLAHGVIIESELDKGRGPVATVLVQKGTLKIGNPIIAGPIFGKVRAMFDERGKPVKIALPSTPVQVVGFDNIPLTGDVMNSMKNERSGREISAKRQQLKRERDFRKTSYMTLDEFSKRMADKSVKELKLIVKADMTGSVEALCDSLIKLSNDEVKITVIHSSVGAITETDVLLASASEAIIIGFQVRPNVKALEVADNEKVDVRTYSIIYDALNDVKSALEGMLDPEEKEEIIGVVEVRDVFKIPKFGNIAGCFIQTGKVVRNGRARVLREGVIIYEGTIDSLKRFKDDAKEVQSGFECGIGIDKFNDIKVGDSLEIFKIVQIKRKME